MSIEFIGLIDTREQSEIKRSGGPVIDREYTRRITRARSHAQDTSVRPDQRRQARR